VAVTVLVTGATGFVGGAAAAELLRCPEADRVLLLVRAASPAAALERVRCSLSRFADGVVESAGPRCQVIVGDLTDGRALDDPRSDEVTHVLHAAGDTSLRSVLRGRHTNVDGTLALADRMRRAPRLVRFLHVGTAYVCGDRPPPLVHEDDYPRPDVRHLVEYTRSKAECERLLDRAIPDLPLVVARPSIVVGHTRLGCGPSASIFWYYRAVDLLRRAPAPPEAHKDIVPVDYVVEALLFLLFKPVLSHRRYHVSAGEAAGVTWGEMAAAFARCHPGPPREPYRVTDFATLTRERARLAEAFGSGDEDVLLRALEPFFRLSAGVTTLFDNRRLLNEGMPPPPRFTDYLPVCVTSSRGRSIYEQLLHDDWGASAPAPPWRCLEPLTPERHASLLRRAVFECCKWDTQVDGRPLVCPFPLVLDGAAFETVIRLASALGQETLAAERELLERPELHGDLGLPCSLRRCLRRIRHEGPACDGPRVMRFDFHWTDEGWRISEANTDVAGGFVEASGVTRLVADCYPGCRATGDPAGVLAEAIRARCRAGDAVGLLHRAGCAEDRQTMLYLAQRFHEQDIPVCLLDGGQLGWRDGGAEACCDWHSGPLRLLFRFLPAEWLPDLPRAAEWGRIFAGGRTPVCNPGYAVLTQTKRFPLVWEQLANPLPTWRSLLPETRSPESVTDLEHGPWVLKPALGHEGYNVRMRRVTDAAAWQGILRAVRRRPAAWAAQRCFHVLPLATPEGLLYPCLGVYVIDGRVAGCYGRLASQPLIDARSREVVVLVRTGAEQAS
jgi:nucleoside-diphosphate-sugar epimerase/glutathionylspermidine synthase